MSTENNFTEAHKAYLTQKAQSYKMELEMILNSTKSNVIPGREYCENCDPRFKLLSTPEKTRNNLLLQKQLSFKNGHIVFNRAFQQEFQWLNPLYYESQQQTLRIANKLTNFPNILQEFNYKFEKDMNTGKLMFLDDYLKSNDIKAGSYRSGYLPLLMAFNKNSQSTPCRMVQCPNRQAVCKPSKNHMAQEPEDKPKLLSYNDCIKS